MFVSSYSLENAARILKVAPSRLRYWQRTSLAVPRASRPAGEAGAGVAGGEIPAIDYDFRDLVGIKAVLSLLEQGISLRRIRRSLEVLRERMPELEEPVVALRLWGQGSLRMVVEHQGRLMEPDGQILLGFLEGQQPESGAVSAIGGGDGGGREQQSIDEATEREQPRSAGEYFERGCQLDSDPGTYDLAIDAYRNAIACDETFADAHCNLGAVFFNRAERAAARRCFERCLRVEPGHVEAHFNLANLLEEDGCNEMALHHYRCGLASDPCYPDLHINLALLLEKMEMPERAWRHWRRYLQLRPDGSWAEVARLRLDRSP